MSGFHEGGCLCGDIRYRAHEPPLEAIVCHCKFCQRRTGAAFGVEVFFAVDQVEFVGSPLKTYQHTSADHGRWLRLESSKLPWVELPADIPCRLLGST
jgi:hypothetical protein